MPVRDNFNYVVLVIDNVHKKYHFLDTMQETDFKKYYQSRCEKVIAFIDAFLAEKYKDKPKKISRRKAAGYQ
ncbi:hypothetical protein LINPERPRIM_LOCUS33984, partial [Linum perenne]